MRTFKNKLHYSLKYIVLGFPILELLLSIIFIKNQSSIIDFMSNSSLLHLLGQSNSFHSSFTNIINSITGLDIGLCSYFAGFILWIFYVYLFDILLDLLVFIPKACHDFFEGRFKKE